MDYNLAVELRDAGFPQEKCTQFVASDEPIGQTAVYTDGLSLMAPTLEELMDELPDHCGLQRDDWGWTMYVKGFMRESTISKTPIEAVSKLYCEINEK